jgi:Phage integrase family
VKTGCARLQVAPATLNCISSRSAGRSQWRRSWRALSARTIDRELARRLSRLDSDTRLNYLARGLTCLSDQVPAFTIHITDAKRGADRYVPILPALADELRTQLQGRQTGFLFESNRHARYSTRTVQSIVTTCTRTAGIKKRVYPHLLRHSIATILLDSGFVPIDQLQKFLGPLDLSTTQIYAETSLRALGDNYIRALGGTR